MPLGQCIHDPDTLRLQNSHLMVFLDYQYASKLCVLSVLIFSLDCGPLSRLINLLLVFHEQES